MKAALTNLELISSKSSPNRTQILGGQDSDLHDGVER